MREHFLAGLDYENRLARFMEKSRRASRRGDVPARSAPGRGRPHLPVSGLAILPPGAVRGPTEAHLPHLGRAPVEPVDETLAQLYDALLAVLRDPTVRDGEWRLLEGVPGWDGNWTWDGFICFGWRGREGQRVLVTVNYASNQGQCYVRQPFDELRGSSVRYAIG